jgi:hypothetical protein
VYAAKRAKEERQATKDKARGEMIELRKELASLRRDKIQAKEPAIAAQIQEKNALLRQLMEEWPTKTQLEKRKALESQSQSRPDSKRPRVDLTLDDDEAIKEEVEDKEDEEDEEGEDDGVELALMAYEALQQLQFNT